MLDNFGKKTEPYMYFIFRVFVGLLFMMHGAQKLGWFAGKNGPLSPAMFAGFMHLPVWVGYFVTYVELLTGLAILLGLFSRLASVIAGIDMLVALAIAHFTQGWNPLLNGGEVALLYLAAFLVIFSLGSGKWSLGKVFFNKEML